MNLPITVYADWDGLDQPSVLGYLHARRSGQREVFEFEYDTHALTSPWMRNIQLDPAVMPYSGPQYPRQGHEIFGMFADSSPDRWGRMLMNRKLEREKRLGYAKPNARLDESDFLLGVHDLFRVGALRFRLGNEGDFLDNDHGQAAPPFIMLRALEQASRALEADENGATRLTDDWLRMLIAPGGSLGGARPKASVVDALGQHWIAKFPSTRDDYDVGAWEAVVHALAQACDIRVPEAQHGRYASREHTFLIKRFDRTPDGRRLHFASAMTLTGHTDGDDASSGASYLEIAQVLMTQGAQPNADLKELWTRIVFNMLISNTDDHMRNHGFLLVPGKGWRLSEAYDMNPVSFGSGLKLNVSEHDNALDLDLARSVCGYFRVPLKQADEIIEDCRSVVSQWQTVATALGLSNDEQRMMAPAFKLAR
ncbi:HipA domain-containing protein [Pseudomonas cichorii]|nr:HipA domain-containing protein [Pseudomonas cichorii]MBX8521480.1 HipA domain-containing protein [Pseudomonas cichorii]MBX8546717.1 HipA domain-containing protein [Pseudomonas cichorii]MBX8561722.1 HipA domain-containing protein [Pseudomonas cichorii]MBX8565852.1 HipA domain-containing protein [Pseudomonas cichorii]MBX8572442.1 HipA domain-containing protein [Pseudomonas cichorii]